MSEVMMLAKNYEAKRVALPAIIFEKLDGVPADFFMRDGIVYAESRQGEVLHSVEHICRDLEGLLLPGRHVIGELHIKDKTFKYIGGKVRAQYNTPELVLNIWDSYTEGHEDTPYRFRMEQADVMLGKRLPKTMKFIPGFEVSDMDSLEQYVKEFMQNNPDAEGVIIRSAMGKLAIGKRNADFMRIKRSETVDLRLIGFEPAIDKKTKKPNGMAGRLWVNFKDGESGVGPGALDHATRKDMVKHPNKYIGRIIEVSYKPDDSYENGLREGHFVQFRDDKTEPNEE